MTTKQVFLLVFASFCFVLGLLFLFTITPLAFILIILSLTIISFLKNK